MRTGRRYGYAVVRRDTDQILEVRWSRAEARAMQQMHPEADALRIDRVSIMLCRRYQRRAAGEGL